MARTVTEKKVNGSFYTPNFIVKSILDLSGYNGDSILKKHVIDNSCGDGAFLEEIVHRYCTVAFAKSLSVEEISCDLAKYVHGIEIDPIECGKCRDRITSIAASYGICHVEWDIICGDALKIHDFDGKMNFVLGNPPYVRVHNLSSSLDDIKKFSFAQGGMTDLFIVFYEIGLRMLCQNGILGYITPSSFFNSVAGSYMRNYVVSNSLLKKVVDLKHCQVFSATTYTTIIIMQRDNKKNQIDYYRFNEHKLLPEYVEKLSSDDYFIGGNFYFSTKENLHLLKQIHTNYGKSDILVKNGYATLCDEVFIQDVNFESPFAIPVVKASKGIMQKIIFPYDENAHLLSEKTLQKDPWLYRYLLNQKEILIKRSNERDAKMYWYAFGRSQALLDTFKDKLAINTLIRNDQDFKFVNAPAGIGVYGGLYIISNTVPMSEVVSQLRSSEFITYVSLLAKYKSGGYYTFSSKDVKSFLDYKFSYDGGLFQC